MSLFDGTLGDCNRPPVSIKLKEGATPYHGRPYPIPQIHKATQMKEINRLVGIGVMKRQSSSQWASPTFNIPKKDIELNKWIFRRPYPIPKISTTLQELEGFTYATSLDLNMGYYTIRLDPRAVEMFTIIFPWGKYSYLRLLMGYAGSADIFQAEMIDLMEALEYVRAYIDDLLVVRMSDCCLQGIKPCECKGKGYQWVGNWVFRRLDQEKRQKSEISERDLQKNFWGI